MLELDDVKKRRRFALLVSLAVHVVFFILCFLFIDPVKVYILDNVRYVFIAPSENLVLPQWDNIVSTRGTVFSSQSQENPEVLVPRQIRSDQRWVQTEPRIEPEGQIEDSGLGVNFQLLPLGRKPTKLLQDHPFNLSLSSERESDFLNWRAKYAGRKDIDFQKYSDVKLARVNARSFLRSSSGVRYDASRGGDILTGEEMRDLSIWADKVVAAVQQSWFVRPSHLGETEGQVKVSMAVGKKGELISAKIDGPPSSALLVESVKAALEMSVPFPVLPETFPGENLRILLVFSLQ